MTHTFYKIILPLYTQNYSKYIKNGLNFIIGKCLVVSCTKTRDSIIVRYVYHKRHWNIKRKWDLGVVFDSHKGEYASVVWYPTEVQKRFAKHLTNIV